MLFFRVFKLGIGIVLLVLCFEPSSAFKLYNKHLTIYDLPKQSELEKYVVVLKDVTNFYLKNINQISISIAFGIFIGNVNLGYALSRHRNTSSRWKADLIDVFIKNEEILKYYQWKIADQESGRECLKISQLFTNVSIWIDHVEAYKPPVDNYVISSDFERFHASWSQYAYAANVRRAKQWIPRPKESDYCLKLLAGSQTTANGICLLDDHCYRMLKTGSDIGYALCHRALLLLMARNSRGCSIFSPREDSGMLDSFCSMSYAEAEYIAFHSYGLVDLMMEQISICTLHGRTEFLRRTWLNNLLEFETSYGCFSQDTTMEEDNDLLKGRCNGHTTALATSVVAAAVRYILEVY